MVAPPGFDILRAEPGDVTTASPMPFGRVCTFVRDPMPAVRVNRNDPLRVKARRDAIAAGPPSERGTKRTSRKRAFLQTSAGAFLLVLWDLGIITFCKHVEYGSDGAFLIAVFGGLIPLFILLNALRVKDATARATIFGFTFNLFLMSILLAAVW